MTSYRYFFIILVSLICIQVYGQREHQHEGMKKRRHSNQRHSRSDHRSNPLVDFRSNMKNRKKSQRQARQMSEIVEEAFEKNLNLSKRPELKLGVLPEFFSTNEHVLNLFQDILPGFKALSSLTPPIVFNNIKTGLLEKSDFFSNIPKKNMENPTFLRTTPPADSIFQWFIDTVISNLVQYKQPQKPILILPKDETPTNAKHHIFLEEFDLLRENLNRLSSKNLDTLLPCAVLLVPYKLLREAILGMKDHDYSFTLPEENQLKSYSKNNLHTTLSSLAMINPSLIYLFRHFKNPDALSYLNALGKLLRDASSMQSTHDSSQSSQFHSLIRIPLEMQLGMSNAFLAFLQIAFPSTYEHEELFYTHPIEPLHLIERVYDLLIKKKVNMRKQNDVVNPPMNKNASLSLPCLLSNELEQDSETNGKDNKRFKDIFWRDGFNFESNENNHSQNVVASRPKLTNTTDNDDDWSHSKTFTFVVQPSHQIPSKFNETNNTEIGSGGKFMNLLIVSHPEKQETNSANEEGQKNSLMNSDTMNVVLVEQNARELQETINETNVDKRHDTHTFEDNDNTWNHKINEKIAMHPIHFLPVF